MDDHDALYAQELRSSEELANCFFSQSWETDAGLHAIATLHYRGGSAEFDLGCRYVKSPNPEERSLGADILSQLGWGKKTFHDETVQRMPLVAGDLSVHD